MGREDNRRRSGERRVYVETSVAHRLLGDVITKLAKDLHQRRAGLCLASARGIDVDETTRERDGVDRHVVEGRVPLKQDTTRCAQARAAAPSRRRLWST
jgi:hypothetical protein